MNTEECKVLFADGAVLVVCKPRGVLSEAGEEGVPTLLAPRYGTLYPVHRLDRTTGGVMVYARTEKAAATLSAAITAGAMQKEYLAIVAGTPAPLSGEMRDLLWKDARANKSYVVDTKRAGAREATLSYRTLSAVTEGEKTFSLVAVTLGTGRSHQIRVQFASRKLPLVGDGKYGSREKAAFPALFAVRLSFPHPDTGASLTFSADPPVEWPWSLFRKTFEIERKFLVAYPDEAAFAALEGARKKEITQTYLVAAEGETRRVRETVTAEGVTWHETVKRRITAVSCVEEERAVTREEYEALLTLRDGGQPIRKTRWCLPYAGHVVEVDLYPFWQDRAIAEIELESENTPYAFPPEITVLREVTEDKRYKNVNLARAVPYDEI